MFNLSIFQYCVLVPENDEAAMRKKKKFFPALIFRLYHTYSTLKK